MANPQRIHYVLVDHENVQPTDIGLLDRADVRVIVFVGAKQGTLSSDMVIDMQNRLGERAKYVRVSAIGKNALDFHIAYTIGRLAVQHPAAHFHVIAADKGYDPLLVHLKDNGIAGSRAERIAALPLFKAQQAGTKAAGVSAAAKPEVVKPSFARVVVEPERSKETVQCAAIQPEALKQESVEESAKPMAASPAPLALAQSKTIAQRWTKLRSGLKKMDGNRPSSLAALKKHVRAQFNSEKMDQEAVDALIAGLVKFGLLVVTANNKLTWHAEKF